jgi:hypothetical protein
LASRNRPGHLGTWHYNGRTWRRCPAATALTGGSALGRDSIWAVGGKSAAHWDGRTWSRTSLARVLQRDTGFCRPSADQIVARSATDVWAVGAAHCQDERGPFYLLHFNGSRWRRAGLPWSATRLAVGAVACVVGSTVTFGGGASYRPGQRGTKPSAVILRYGR